MANHPLWKSVILLVILPLILSQNNNCVVEFCQICLTDNTCSQCIDGYYVHPSGACQPCSDNFCRICPYNPYCQQCKSGFYLRSLDQQCRNCQQLNCLSCSSNGNCSKCFESFYLQPAGSNLVCKECANGCKTCDNNKTCSTCKQGFFVIYINGGSFCESCELNLCRTCDSFGSCLSCFNGSFLNTDQKGVSRCFSCIDPNCQTCENLAGICLSCSTGFYLSKTGTVECLPCSASGCSICSSLTNCSACADGYVLASNSCQACQTANCKFCGYGVCTECMQGYFLKPINQILGCASCSSINCQNCYTNGTCYECLSNYYLSKGGCIQCTDSNCDSCPSNNCLACIQGYVIPQTSNVCTPCLQNNCAVCDTNRECMTCISGMFLIDGQCQSCSVSNCQQCKENNVRACDLCETGYFLKEAKCHPCADNNCSRCAAVDGSCLQCLDNYYEYNGLCVRCNLDLCAYCVFDGEQVTCQACIQGYYWNENQSQCSVNLYQAASAPPVWLMVVGLLLIIVILLFAYRYMLKRHLQVQASQALQNQQPYRQFQEIN